MEAASQSTSPNSASMPLARRSATCKFDLVVHIPKPSSSVRDAFIVRASEANPGGDPQGVADGVAIIATNWWLANKAREKLDAIWDEGPVAAQSSTGFAAKAKELSQLQPASYLRRDGDVAAALTKAAHVVEASYAYPFLSHIDLEPQNCTAHVTPDKVEIWVPTQSGEGALAAAASAAKE